MLVLTQKPDETVVIRVGEIKIEVTILRAEGKKVHVGFSAPKHVAIYRERIDREIHPKDYEEAKR